MSNERVLCGAWPLPPARVDGVLFDELDDEVQAIVLRLALGELSQCIDDLSDNERFWFRRHIEALASEERLWLLAHLPPHPPNVEPLDRQERADLAGVVCLLLRRKKGWAA